MVEEFLCEFLWTINQIDWHKVLVSWSNFLLSNSSLSSLFLFADLLFVIFSVSSDTLDKFNIWGILGFNIIIRIAFWQLFERLCGWNEEKTGDESDFGRGVKASIGNNIDSSIIGPNISLIEIDHDLKWFLGGFITVLRNILWDIFFKFLIDLIVLMMLVHPSQIVHNVFVQNYS